MKYNVRENSCAGRYLQAIFDRIKTFGLMINFKRADHIHICVPAARLEEARLFYRDVVGLPEKYRPVELNDQGIWFQASDIELHVGVEEQQIETIRHTAFEVSDLEAARQQLLQRGVVIQKQRAIAGRNRFSFLDPFGNRMELLEYSVDPSPSERI